MTLARRVQRARRTLLAAASAGAALRAVAAALAVVVAAVTADTLVALPDGVRRLAPVAALLAGVVLFVGRIRRSGLRSGAGGVALWIEAREPSLRYALVTAVDPFLTGRVPEAERAAARVAFEPVVRRGVRKALAGPAVAVLALALLLLMLPRGSVARVTAPAPGDALGRIRPGSQVDPLATIVARVSPPAYSGLRSYSASNPVSVRALVGSTITIEGVARDGVVSAAVVAGDSARGGAIAAVSGSGRWTLSLVMPAAPAAVHLRAAASERLLGLEPVTDSAPVVVLALPSRDSVLRAAAGRLVLSARATDDYGLASGEFELIVSSGGGENFTFRSRTLARTVFTARSGELAASLALDTLGLRPGDMLHVRAVARDRNDVTGAGVGSSDTRTLRIARADEYDSVAVDAAPPPDAETDALSQRMLLMLAQALERRRPSLAHATLVSESRGIAADQTRLRKRVGTMVFARLGEDGGEEGNALDRRLDRPVSPDSVLAAADRAASAATGTAQEGTEDETPLVATNRPLLEAYNAMWRASSELEVGEPGRAVPFMQQALDALQAARAAERIYLRGRTRAVVVDVARVRLEGKERGAPTPLTPRPSADPARDQRLARFDAALRLAPRAPAAAADSLLLLRLDLLGRDDRGALALGSAADALRGSRDATAALIRARRALADAAAAPQPLSAWGAPP